MSQYQTHLGRGSSPRQLGQGSVIVFMGVSKSGREERISGRQRVFRKPATDHRASTATLVLFPSAMLAFFPAPAVWMDVEMDARGIDVSVRRVPAVAISIANNPSRCVQRRHSDQRNGRSGQNKQLRSGCMSVPQSKVTSSNVLGRGRFQKLPSQKWASRSPIGGAMTRPRRRDRTGGRRCARAGRDRDAGVRAE